MPEVRCAVSNCSFWGHGNFCQANEIIVQPDEKAFTNFADASYQNSVLSGMQMESPVADSADTCCQTFQPKYE
ncbi:DUF1540 domain-containing protein [Ectobacillus panaciterrae]|uniref:DUF1540 domain-containing protein n=1 Tax=Ectobacillus panaciterrae TaxID=363872 RepID=UPI000404F285|nr:DUF1540 domain-containing protein [Ectobacillus panaciterrae]